METKTIRKIISVLKEKETPSMLAKAKYHTPFFVLISTVLSARNRDEMTEIAADLLLTRYPTPEKLAKAKLKEIEPLIKKSGFYKVKAKRVRDISRMIVDKYDGKIPADMDLLVGLPGVGRKTAGCVLVYAFEKPAIPVDTHVHRISNRLGWVKTDTPEKTEIALMKLVPKDLWLDVNEVMVIHGQTICRPIGPKCKECPISKYCPSKH